MRITSIIEHIFRKTKRALDKTDDELSNQANLEGVRWKTYPAGHAGYFQLVRKKVVIKILKEHIPPHIADCRLPTALCQLISVNLPT